VRNYIVIGLLLLIRNKIFSLINILGLSVGIASCLLIALYIQDEFSYEKGFKDHHRIFRINTTVISDGVPDKFPRTTPPMAFGLAEALPEVETATRTMKPLGVEQNIISCNDKMFFEKSVLLVDSNFLKVFDDKFLRGDPATALDAPSTLLISENAAERIFGKIDPMDETIIINSGHNADTLHITGVVATPRFPSHLDAELCMSMNCNSGAWVLAQTTWDYNNMVESYHSQIFATFRRDRNSQIDGCKWW
jgi:putative ABC transport system permease protein